MWRGERPQKGRYREFLQCDFDTIGTLSAVADIETVLVIHDLLLAIGVGEFTIRLNHRQILNGLLGQLGLADQSTVVLRCLDKLPKVGPTGVQEEITAHDVNASAAEQILSFAQLQGDAEKLLVELDARVGSSECGQLGVARMREVIQGVRAAGVPSTRLELDVSIARGLDYYTGTIVETFPRGTYPRLAAYVLVEDTIIWRNAIQSRRCPASVRPSAWTGSWRRWKNSTAWPSRTSSAQVFLAFFETGRRDDYLALAAQLRICRAQGRILPRIQETGGAAQVRLRTRVPGRSDCRRRRVSNRHLPDQGLESTHQS